MLAYAIRRVLISIPVLIGSSMLVFLMGKLSGDPLEPLRLTNPPVPPETIRLEEHRLGLDVSWPQQYWNWIRGLVLHGYWGPSVHATDDIGAELGSALWVTLRLVVASVLIALTLAVITGVVSAMRQYSALDYTATFFGFLFLSMPVFWFGILLKSAGIWYNENVHADTFYTIGDRSVFLTDNSFWSQVRDVAGHMILPTVVLGLAVYAAWSRFTRASMLEVLNSDHVRLARAKGLRARRVLIRHALRNALIPLTTISALDIAALLGGAIITETVFQWHGMGALFLQSLRDVDVYLMMGWLLVSAAIVILFNLVADLLYGVLDPRIRHA
ncbi:MAG TPA: ABC transporter permease [Rugosimonospora sp.]|nr:ABC transporter permease [Rugosimonospora sp.]